MRQVHDAATADEVLRRYASVMADVAGRAYPIVAVVVAAADAEPQIAALAEDLDQQRLMAATAIAAAACDRLGQRDARHRAYVRDTLWTLNSPLLYGLLVGQRGWSADAYRDWMATALVALVGVPPQPPAHTRVRRSAR